MRVRLFFSRFLMSSNVFLMLPMVIVLFQPLVSYFRNVETWKTADETEIICARAWKTAVIARNFPREKI